MLNQRTLLQEGCLVCRVVRHLSQERKTPSEKARGNGVELLRNLGCIGGVHDVGDNELHRESFRLCRERFEKAVSVQDRADIISQHQAVHRRRGAAQVDQLGPAGWEIQQNNVWAQALGNPLQQLLEMPRQELLCFRR